MDASRFAATLPSSPNIEHLKKQAKRRLKLLRQADPSTRLAAAQFAVARDYGFPSWPQMKAHLVEVSKDLPGDLPNPWAQELPAIVAAATRRGDLDEAENAILSLIKQHPADDDLSACLGAFLLNFRQDHRAATIVYERLLERPTANGLAHYASFLGVIGAGDLDAQETIYRRAIEIGETGSKFSLALNNYASFLEYRRKNMAEAEQYFRRAAELGSRFVRVNAIHQGLYAEFLWRRGEAIRAEEYFRLSRAGSRREAKISLSFATMLTATGRIDEGLALIPEVLSSWWLQTLWHPVPAELVCWFLLYAHGPSLQRAEAISELKSRLRPGNEVFHLNLRRNAAAAAEQGHPAAELVTALAEILSAKGPTTEATIKSLDRDER